MSIGVLGAGAIWAHVGVRLAAAGSGGSVNTRQPSSVTTTVCSKCADNCLSFVTAVQPSPSTFTAGFPAFTIGSIARVIPSASLGPRPAVP